ncbi:MAG: hypothetical protein IKW06_06145 [Clostridia bacterium]|nr:hypothetical protein [Clostridia bacterium]
MRKQIYIVDGRYREDISRLLGKDGTVLPSVRCENLAEPVSYHPDMVLFQNDLGEVICEPTVYEAYSRLLSPFGIPLVQGKKRIFCDYPEDVAYNVLSTRGFAFARWDKTEEKIAEVLQQKGVQKIQVAQGYSRCGALAVDGGIITADPSISKAAEGVGLSVLTICPGHVMLPGYDYGFIGGAAGILEEKTVVFYGGLDTHPDGARIKDFILKQGYAVRDLPGRLLLDVGTIFAVTFSA